MTNDITILIDGRPVTPTRLRRILLPLGWLFIGFATLGFVTTVIERTSLAWGLAILAIPLIIVLAIRAGRHTHDYDPETWECTECGKSNGGW